MTSEFIFCSRTVSCLHHSSATVVMHAYISSRIFSLKYGIHKFTKCSLIKTQSYSHGSYSIQALGLELSPVSWQSARR